MATIHRFVVTLPHVSGISEDRATNTWHFERPTIPVPVTDYDNVRDMLADFYVMQPPGASNSIASHMSPTISGFAAVAAYDLEEPSPRRPVYESTFPIAGAGGTALPSEVAVCMSFQAARSSGVAQASRRNRIYLGPWGVPANENGLVKSSLQTIIVKAGQELAAAADASATWNWVVYSPKKHEAYPVHDGWVDNAFDTQRRRGISATGRSTFLAP